MKKILLVLMMAVCSIGFTDGYVSGPYVEWLYVSYDNDAASDWFIPGGSFGTWEKNAAKTTGNYNDLDHASIVYKYPNPIMRYPVQVNAYVYDNEAGAGYLTIELYHRSAASEVALNLASWSKIAQNPTPYPAGAAGYFGEAVEKNLLYGYPAYEHTINQWMLIARNSNTGKTWYETSNRVWFGTELTSTPTPVPTSTPVPPTPTPAANDYSITILSGDSTAVAQNYEDFGLWLSYAIKVTFNPPQFPLLYIVIGKLVETDLSLGSVMMVQTDFVSEAYVPTRYTRTMPDLSLYSPGNYTVRWGLYVISPGGDLVTFPDDNLANNVQEMTLVISAPTPTPTGTLPPTPTDTPTPTITPTRVPEPTPTYTPVSTPTGTPSPTPTPWAWIAYQYSSTIKKIPLVEYTRRDWDDPDARYPLVFTVEATPIIAPTPNLVTLYAKVYELITTPTPGLIYIQFWGTKFYFPAQ